VAWDADQEAIRDFRENAGEDGTTGRGAQGSRRYLGVIMQGLRYQAGGNPPHTPGLYLNNKIIAFWPVLVKPTEERCMNIFRLWEARGSKAALGHVEVRKELAEGGML
jgi:hypothetical protein